VRSSVDKTSFYLSQNVWKRGKITLNIISLMSVQALCGEARQRFRPNKLAFADLPQHPRDFLVSLVSWRSA
jgi:hypothetical protein